MGADDVGELVESAIYAAGRGEGAQEGGTVAAGGYATVEDDHCAAIGLGAYEATEALPQSKDCLRDGVLHEGVVVEFGARLEYGFAWHGKRQTGDYQDAESVSGQVNALPEAGGAEQDGAGILQKRRTT